jgi:hypothetical protein
MNGSASFWLAGSIVAILLGGASGCMQVPEPLELELDDAERLPPPMGFDLARPTSVPYWLDELDYAAWPLSDDPELAALGQRELRSYPLWPTPISEPCPEVTFARFEPQLDAGATFERVRERLLAVGDSRLGGSLTELVLLHDHIDVAGLQLVLAASTPGICMKNWSQTHCFVTATDVYCPGGGADELERLVRAHGLLPRSLHPAAWLELAAVMTGSESIVIEPSLVRECTSIGSVEALAPTVALEDDRVTIRFTSIGWDDRTDHTVIIERDGEVTMATGWRWRMPGDEHVWGTG